MVAPKASSRLTVFDADLLATVGSQLQTHTDTVVPGYDIVGVSKNHAHTPTHRSKKRRLLPDWMKKKPDAENPGAENPEEDPDAENPEEHPDAEKHPQQEATTPRVNQLSSLDFSLLFTNFSNSRLVTKARQKKKKQFPPARGQLLGWSLKQDQRKRRNFHQQGVK